ncbi:hypothetical protein H4R24_003275 [Coemansia sp. RSA 988]|nr:hypothetical protein H4R24_003275 [Coemansia sp. RSA 988]
MADLTDVSMEELHNLKRKQLQSLCKKRGLKANGKNEELIEQLLEQTQHGSSGEQGDDASDTGSNNASDNDDDETPPSAAEDASETEKVFKDIPSTSDKPLVMEDPNTMKRVDDSQFQSMADKVTAEMEARVAAMAAGQRKDAIEQYNKVHNIAPTTPNRTEQQSKTISFNMAHDKIFDGDDSIANHWSAKRVPGTATPKNKRTNGDDSMLASNKRPRLEPLFPPSAVVGSPFQSPGQRRKSTKSKAMTARARRTAASTLSNALDGSKTVAVGTRVKSADIDKMVGTKLFADKASASESADRIEDSVPTTESVALSLQPAGEPETATSDTVEEPSKSPTKSVQVQQQELTKKLDLQESDTISEVKVQEVTMASTNTEVAVADTTELTTSTNPVGTKPGTAVSKSMRKPTSNAGTSMTSKGISSKPKQSQSSTSARPTLIPKSKRTTKSGASQLQSKTHAEAKETNKGSSDSSGSNVSTSKKGSNGSANPVQKTTSTKQIPSHKPKSYRNVESKIKSYINAKPAEASKPKTKLGASSTTNAVGKPVAPTSKQVPKSTISKTATAPNSSAHAKKKVESDKNVPSYMRSTKATEIRSQKQNIKPTTTGSSRFAPYARPAKQAKQSIAN